MKCNVSSKLYSHRFAAECIYLQVPSYLFENPKGCMQKRLGEASTMVHLVFPVDISFFFHNFVKLITLSQASYVGSLLSFLAQFKLQNRKYKIKFQISVYISLVLFPMDFSKAGTTSFSWCFFFLSHLIGLVLTIREQGISAPLYERYILHFVRSLLLLLLIAWVLFII